MLVLVMCFQPGLMFVDQAYPTLGKLQSYLQTLDQGGKAGKGQTLWLIVAIYKLQRKLSVVKNTLGL